MAAPLETAAAEMRKAASLGLQLEILKHKPMADVEKSRMLENMRSEASELLSSTVPEAQNLSRQSDMLISSTSEIIDSTSLQIVPSFIVRAPNSSSFQQFPEDHEHIRSETDT